jgi:NAD(P)-dependent dehydrogenase (short-subunit alcohol dehydrogenase family)
VTEPTTKRATATYPSLAGKTVFVSGGARGIGEAIVRAFAAQGAKVGFVDILQTEGAALAAELQKSGATIRFEPADVTDIPAYRAAIGNIAEALGPITILVNNAAEDTRHEWQGETPESFEQRLAVNLKHQFFAIQAVAPGMIAAGGGAIVNYTSTSFMMNNGGMPVYTAAKAGVIGLTKGVAGDLGPHNIRVNAIAPGWVMTERQKDLWVTDEKLAGMVARQCLKEPIQPADMVGPCLFLASKAARMITAQVLIADGGAM